MSEESIQELRGQIDTMKRELDGLQVAFVSRKKPWFRDVSTLIAVLALAFSFGTTFVSYRRTEGQDLQASRQELRGILQTTNAIPREIVQASKKYAPDQTTIAELTGMYNQENVILTRQAAEIARKLPKGLVSATEYFSIASSYMNSYNLSGAREFLSYATQNATDFEDALAAIRASASLDFMTGQPSAGRLEWGKALDIFSIYPSTDSLLRVSTTVNTELEWASSELEIGQTSLANQHIENAALAVQGAIASPVSDGRRAQIEQARQTVSRGGQVITPTSLMGPSPASSAVTSATTPVTPPNP
jgi:hypothetical protein